MHEAAKFVKEEELLRLLMAGFMLKEAARQMGLSYHTVRKYAREPKFLLKLQEHSAEIYRRVDTELMNNKEAIVERLEQAADAALTKMESLMDSNSPNVAFRAAQDIMDRDRRISRQRRIESEGKQELGFLNPIVLQHMVATAREVDAFEERRELESGDSTGNLTDS